MSNVNKANRKYGALAEACYGHGVSEAAAHSRTSGVHPAAGMKRYGDRSSTYNYGIPDQALAQGVSDAQVVLCLQDEEKVLIERCPYGKEGDQEATKVVERYIYQLKYRLVEAKTGAVLDEGMLKGSEPRPCLDEETFLKGQQTMSVEGEKVSNAQIQEFLRPYLIIP